MSTHLYSKFIECLWVAKKRFIADLWYKLKRSEGLISMLEKKIVTTWIMNETGLITFEISFILANTYRFRTIIFCSKHWLVKKLLGFFWMFSFFKWWSKVWWRTFSVLPNELRMMPLTFNDWSIKAKWFFLLTIWLLKT